MKITGFPEEIELTIRERNEMGLVRDFTQKETGVTLDTTTITLVNESAKRLNDWIYNNTAGGALGGAGRFENPPAWLTTNAGIRYPQYLNLAGMTGKDYEIQVGIESRKGNTHFFDKAKGLTFELMRRDGALPDDIMVNVPYVIQQDDVMLQAVVLLSTGITLTINLINLIKATADLAADALDFIGTGLAAFIAKAIVYAIWIALTAIAIIQAAIQLKELLFPKIRYFKALSDYELIKRGIEYLGFTLESSFLESIKQIHTLPVPELEDSPSIFDFLQNETNDYFNAGYPKAGDSTPTLWSLINHYLTGYNMEIFVNNGVVKIEHESTLMQTATVTVKPTFTLQDERASDWRYNDEDVFGRKYIYWQVDYDDTHSPDRMKGLRAEYITEPVTVINPDLVNVTNLVEIPLDFSWLARKNGLTKPEKIARDLLAAADNLINAFGGSSNLAATVDQRIGVGMISSQYFSKTKKIWIDPSTGRQPADYYNRLSADNIFVDWHAIKNVSEYCRKMPGDMTVPFTEDNFNALLSNYFINLTDGTKAKVLLSNWKDRQYKAVLRVAVPDASGFNVKTTKVA